MTEKIRSTEERIQEIIYSMNQRTKQTRKRNIKEEPTKICLPFLPSNGKVIELSEKKKLEKRKRVRRWDQINKSHANQDLYAWELISLVVDSIEVKQQKNYIGRPQANMRDLLKYAILKVWSKKGFRKQYSFNLLYKNAGFTNALFRRTTINNVFTQKRFTSYLEQVYKALANIMIPFENSFAVDATGYSTRYNSRWVQIKLDFKKHKDYKKLHIICGINTQIITSCKITSANEQDTLFLKELVGDTAKRFNMRRVCADAGYISRENVQFIADQKAEPFILPRNWVWKRSKGYLAWNKMLRSLYYNPLLWQKNYNLRVHVESVNSRMKTTLLDSISSKKSESQENELLIRVICHNLTVIIDAIFRFNINPFNE